MPDRSAKAGSEISAGPGQTASYWLSQCLAQAVNFANAEHHTERQHALSDPTGRSARDAMPHWRAQSQLNSARPTVQQALRPISHVRWALHRSGCSIAEKYRGATPARVSIEAGAPVRLPYRCRMRSTHRRPPDPARVPSTSGAATTPGNRRTATSTRFAMTAPRSEFMAACGRDQCDCTAAGRMWGGASAHKGFEKAHVL